MVYLRLNYVVKYRMCFFIFKERAGTKVIIGLGVGEIGGLVEVEGFLLRFFLFYVYRVG